MINNKGIVFPAVYANKALKESKQDKSSITAHGFIIEHAKRWYSRWVSYTVRFLIFTFHFDRNRFRVRTAPMDGAVEKLFLSLYGYIFYITCIIKHWRNSLVKDVCTTLLEGRCIDYTGKNDVYTPVRYCPKCVQNKPYEKWQLPRTTILSKWDIWI